MIASAKDAVDLAKSVVDLAKSVVDLAKSVPVSGPAEVATIAQAAEPRRKPADTDPTS